MTDRSCCDCLSEADRSFFDSLFNNFIRGGTIAVIIHTTFISLIKPFNIVMNSRSYFHDLKNVKKIMNLHKIHELKK